MFLLVLFVFLSESDGNDYSFRENLTPYETFLSGPYWTYPVRKSNLVHGLGYFRELRFGHLRFKRDSVLTQEVSSDHEFPRDVPTKPEYGNKGQWAKGKIPGKETELGFVPLQIYSQVRAYDTFKHLPRSAALKEASTPEEVAAAPRLREILSHKKTQQVYEEEGYEDSGYDHGFYDHHGAKYEDKEKNYATGTPKASDSQVKSAEEVGVTAKLGDQPTSPKLPLVGYFKNSKSESQQKSTRWGDGEESFLLEERHPKMEDTSGQFTLVNGKRIPLNNKTVIQENETVVTRVADNPEGSRENQQESISLDLTDIAAPRSGVADEAEVRVINDPRPKGKPIVFPGRYTRRQYGLGRPINNWTPMAPADVYIQGSIGYQLKRPFFPGDSLTHHYVPYVPFPNFYSDNPTSYASPVPHIIRLAVKTTRSPFTHTKRGELHGAGTLTAYASLVSNNQSAATETDPNKTGYIQPRSNNSVDLGLSRTRIIGREKHYNSFTRGNKTMKEVTIQPAWNINKTLLYTRHPSLPRDSKEKIIEIQHAHAGALVAEKPEQKTRKPADWPVKYIEQLTIAHYSSPENNPIKTNHQNNTERLITLTKMLNAHNGNYARVKREATVHYDEQKYPFYHGISSGSNGNKDSALKYATNPDMMPKKTPGGMEFYESRDRLVRCKEPSTPEDVIPERKEDGDWNKNVQVETPRLKGLGDSIECLKNKYFGKEPLDNPFFQEGVEPMSHRASEKIETAPLRKLRTGDNTKRQTGILNQENSTKHYYTSNAQKDYSNHKMTRDNNSNFVFPYKNHRPESEPIPPVYDYRTVNTYPYHIENANNKNYYSVYETSQESGMQADVSKPRYRPHHHMYTPFYVRKKFQPQPVSIYSIISHKGNPSHHRPLLFAHSTKAHHVLPMYPLLTATTQSPDNIASDTQAKPVKWYIIRPGEYTENKDLAEEKKETPSIWSYMNPLNPLKWWFPSLFDNRRKEPRYRKRRAVDYEYDIADNKDKRKTLGEPNLDTPLNSDAANKAHAKIPANHKPETSTKASMPLGELKLKLNVTQSIKSRLSRLSGGYLSRSNASFVDHSAISNSSLPVSTEPTTRSLEAPPTKSKISFPRTKIPLRKFIQYKKPFTADKKTMRITTTTKGPTTVVTRMYKPKKIINPKFVPRTHVDAFSVLKAQTSKSGNPFDSYENEQNPRELQQIEHRRVTKEETYKTTYTPQEEDRKNREGGRSIEEVKYSATFSDPHTQTENSENGTLTYLVDPATGLGIWGEQPRRRAWKPKKKLIKRNGKSGRIYSYPSVGRRSENMSTHAPPTKRSDRRQKDQDENEAYIVSLMSRVPLPVQRHPKKQYKPVANQRESEGRRIESLTEETENYPSPVRTTTQFIRDPDKRKYFYVND